MLQHHEIKRLQTQLAEMPQAATAAAMADLKKQLDFARSKPQTGEVLCVTRI